MNLTIYRSWSVILLVVTALLGWYLYAQQTQADGSNKFRFGLDLVGGSHLVYEADTSKLATGDVNEAMRALRDVIERRTNAFAVSEPIVQVEKASALSGSSKADRLIVELPGVTDLNEAITMIGATPQLEFKLVGETVGTTTTYIDTGITGRLLERADAQLSGSNGQTGFSTNASISVRFNDEGKALFAKLTTDNVGKNLAIFLDGELKSDPVIREPITGGTAVISGNFSTDEARQLARDLNIGALPVPITLASTESIGASLGMETLTKSLLAGMVGLIIICVFMVGWYRLPGLIASIALVIYIVFMLGIFMFLPVTLTAAGLAGFILSMGMAVDANVLIFERTKEELRTGKSIPDAVSEGFARAWLSIRDGNSTNIIAAIVLFWFGTSIVKGFALVYGLGLAVHMLTAITITRTFLLALGRLGDGAVARALFSSGFSKV